MAQRSPRHITQVLDVERFSRLPAIDCDRTGIKNTARTESVLTEVGVNA